MEAALSLCFIAPSTLLAFWFLSGGKSKQLCPPGPWTLPIIGSLHHVISSLPHRKFTELSRRHGPLMFLKLGEIPAVVVSSAEVAEMVLKTSDPMFASRPGSVIRDIATNAGKGIAFAPYGDRWRQMRKICILELLSSKQVKRMEGIRGEETGNLLRFISASSSTGGTINISEKVAALTNVLVTRAAFGGRFTGQDEYMQELDRLLELMSGFCLVDMFPSSRLLRWLSSSERLVKRSTQRIQRMVADIVDKRKVTRNSARSAENEDLLDVLLGLQEEDSLTFPLTTEIIGAVLLDLFGGATDTTSSILVWAMSELVNHREAMLKAQLEVRQVLGEGRTIISSSDLAELHYMRLVIKEAFRLHPPGPLLSRIARGDSKIMGYDILEGTNVFINIFAISRDPKYWRNPEEFTPERFENNNLDYNGTHFQFIPFGAGRRQCPGIQFTSSVLEVILANFLYHFDWMLPEDDSLSSIDMSEKFGLSVGRKYDLKLRAIPRALIRCHQSDSKNFNSYVPMPADICAPPTYFN